MIPRPSCAQRMAQHWRPAGASDTAAPGSPRRSRYFDLDIYAQNGASHRAAHWAALACVAWPSIWPTPYAHPDLNRPL